MSVYRVLLSSCPPVTRVLLFNVTSIGHQYRVQVNASSKHQSIFKYFLLCILIYTIYAEYAEFAGTLLETSANNPDFHSSRRTNSAIFCRCYQG
jgi:hypothetical protein